MTLRSLTKVLAVFLLVGCSADDDSFVSEQPAPVEEGAYVEECRWIYGTMHHYYYWNEDLPDSLDCDYTLAPVDFFKSLLSKKDRFSYCEQRQGSTRSGHDTTWPEVPQFDIWTGEMAANPFDTNKSNVLLDSVYHIAGHTVGYLCYSRFDKEQELEPVMRHFHEEHIDELVLDLRYNPGGYLSTSQYLATSVVPDSVYGRVFQLLRYNHRVSQELYAERGDSLSSYSFLWPTDPDNHLDTPLYGLSLNRVFILVSNHTASASEVMITCMRPFINVTVVGERTVGKGVGMNTFSDSKYKYELVPITFRYYNVNMETTPDEGIEPDYEVPNGYNTAKAEIGKEEEPLFAKVIELLQAEAAK